MAATTNPCPRCGQAVGADLPFCPNCGHRLQGSPLVEPAAAGPPPAATLVLNEPQASGKHRIPGAQLFTGHGAETHRAVTVDELFGAKIQLLVGRASNCDVWLPHPSISRAHALLERTPEGLRLRDLGSVNGVWVGGRRITEPILLRPQERVGIGPFLFTLSGGVIHSLDSSRSLRLEARNLKKVIQLRDGPRSLLENVSLAVEPGEFVALLGPSGSGKSTLMDCLNGRRPATTGRVLANGEDFYRHFDNFRQSLGYVPQRDIVHTQLTVYRALYYTARLRLPADTEASELRTRLQDVLTQMELAPHRDTPVGNLSGGQIKRVSLGAELLARPCLLYIDEATSGLDAGTEARMMRLFRQLSDEGRSVLCITHALDNVDLCDLLVVLCAGRLVYVGPPGEALSYFQIGRIGELYDRLGAKPAAEWVEAFRGCSLFKEYVQGRLERQSEGSLLLREGLVPPAAPPPAPPAPPPVPAAPPGEDPRLQLIKASRTVWQQFHVLTARYAELLWRDPRTLQLLMLQAPVIGLFFLLAFAHQPYQHQIPVTRMLTTQERQVLQTVQDLLNVLADDHPLTAEERQALDRIRVQTGDGKAVSAADLVLGLRAAQRLPGADQVQPQLAAAKVRLRTADGAETVVSLADLLQAPKHLKEARVVELLLKSPLPIVPQGEMTDPRYTYLMVFILVITVLWFGCNNAAREIVKEEAIYLRERSVNLQIGPYLGSKFLLLGSVGAVQVLLLLAIIHGVLEGCHYAFGYDLPAPEYALPLWGQYLFLVLVTLTGAALGLLLSACVTSPDRAATLLPYVLIPQIILGGGFIPIHGGPLWWIAVIASPVYWGFRAVRTGETELPAGWPFRMDYDDSLWLPCAALAAQALGLLLVTAWILRGKDVWKGRR